MSDGLASRLNKLFDVMHKADAPALSTAAAAAAIAEKTGVTITPDDLRRLRDGSQTSAAAVYLAAITEFFCVPAAYLTDDDVDPMIDAQLNLLRALRDHRVGDVRLCGGELSPETLNGLAATITDCVRTVRPCPPGVTFWSIAGPAVCKRPTAAGRGIANEPARRSAIAAEAARHGMRS